MRMFLIIWTLYSVSSNILEALTKISTFLCLFIIRHKFYRKNRGASIFHPPWFLFKQELLIYPPLKALLYQTLLSSSARYCFFLNSLNLYRFLLSTLRIAFICVPWFRFSSPQLAILCKLHPNS